MTEEFIKETIDYLKAKLEETLKETDAGDQQAYDRAYSIDQLDYELFTGLDKLGMSFIVLHTADQAYGLIWKDKGGDDNDIYYKCTVYKWPQEGMIVGGKTFFTGSKGLADAVKKAISEF